MAGSFAKPQRGHFVVSASGIAKAQSYHQRTTSPSIPRKPTCKVIGAISPPKVQLGFMRGAETNNSPSVRGGPRDATGHFRYLLSAWARHRCDELVNTRDLRSDPRLSSTCSQLSYEWACVHISTPTSV